MKNNIMPVTSTIFDSVRLTARVRGIKQLIFKIRPTVVVYDPTLLQKLNRTNGECKPRTVNRKGEDGVQQTQCIKTTET